MSARATAILLGFCLLLLPARGETRLKPYEHYINKYAPEAMRQQMTYGIPASITLAQGLLESNAGNGTLARKSNNHFGIKCNHGWKGATYSHFDDGQMCCFRKYRTVADSYKDHSEFIAYSPRYGKLFRLKKTDYKGWARGLKEAGYATDRQYADKLIRLIETYELYKYDKIASNKRQAKETISNWRVEEESAPVASKKQMLFAENHEIYYTGTTPYILVEYGDTYLKLSGEFDITVMRLRSLNDFPKDHELQIGEKVYVGRKSRKWNGDNSFHTLKAGESLHDVSQRYAIRLDSLIKMNQKRLAEGLQEGDQIKLR